MHAHGCTHTPAGAGTNADARCTATGVLPTRGRVVRACVQGHDIIGYTPRPQQSVAWSAQTLAHGATQLLFFRYRAAVFGQEEFCYGVRCRHARARTHVLCGETKQSC